LTSPVNEQFNLKHNFVWNYVKFQILVIDYKLSYPSGTATAVLINGFHAPQGDDLAKYAVL
jgi:uncharacterized oligopeptide transporter (OPT) family protein